jgi:ceroid-lipofuscinosis protein 6
MQNISSCLSKHNSNGHLTTEIFELLYFYDEHLGHSLWYLPFFMVFVTIYFSSFSRREVRPTTALPLSGWFLLPLDTLFYVYLVTEGQIFTIFAVALAAMIGGVIVGYFTGYSPDVNARYLLSLYTVAAILIGVWSLYFWDHTLLRDRYPGLIFIPEPWSVYSIWKAGLL